MTARVAFAGGFLAGTLAGVAGYMFVQKDNIDKIHIEFQEQPRLNPVSGDVLKRGQEILKYGMPVRAPDASIYKNHVLCYDQARKIPLWAAEHLTPESLKGNANRKKSKFKADPSIPAMFSAKNTDYVGSGWSRGHMAAAGDNKISQKAMDETFYLSNILPQDIDNNGGFWNRTEIYCRDLTKQYPNVRIVSGPLMQSNEGREGKRFVKYQVVGHSRVAVPTHLYKVILAENADGSTKALAAFVVPNQPIPRSHTLKQYQHSLEYVEQKIGYTIMPKLDRTTTSDLCEVEGCKLMDYALFELYFFGRKLEGARTLHRLEVVWKELEQKKIKPDRNVTDIYNAKKIELAKKQAERPKEK